MDILRNVAIVVSVLRTVCSACGTACDSKWSRSTLTRAEDKHNIEQDAPIAERKRQVGVPLPPVHLSITLHTGSHGDLRLTLEV